MTQDVVNIAVKYDIKGLDDSIKGTQRLLYLTNAVRLSVKDIKMSIEDPSFQNLMWTTIQLTRAWSHLYALVWGTKKAAAAAGQQSLLSSAMGGPGLPQLQRLRNQMLAQYGLMVATQAGQIAFGFGVTAVAGVAAYYLLDRRNREMRDTWIEQQEKTARSQGI